MKRQHWKLATFRIESLQASFPGYTDGSLWNGWECPYFEFDTAKELLVASEPNGYRWLFNQENNSFEVRHVDDLPEYGVEVFEAISIEVDNQLINAYGIGAYSWVWESAN